VIAAVLILMLRLLTQYRAARAGGVLGTALFADGFLRFALAPFSADYADAPALLHVATPAQAIAMLMVALGGVCWLSAVHHV
jgi:prolipoprotein diacylglyceryltransferase